MIDSTYTRYLIRVVKLIETKRIMVVAEVRGGRNEKLFFYGYRVGGDGCTTMQTNLLLLN